MKYFIFLICLFFIISSCKKQDGELQYTQQFIEKIKSEMAPDEREAVFDVSVKKSGGIVIVKGETNLAEAKSALWAGLHDGGEAIVDSLIVLPDEKNDSLSWALVNVSVCNLRTNPGYNTELASQALLGTPLRVLKKQNNWCLVQSPDKYIGWIDSGALFFLSQRGIENWKNQSKMIYQPSFGLASHPESGQPVTDLVAGCILHTVKKAGTDCLLSMPDGRLLKVASSDVVDFDTWKNKDIPPVAEISKTAAWYMGRPYLWGGTSDKGVDCSGFVKMVYFLNGLILARDASLQFRHGEIITPDQGWQALQQGDLVFFGRKAVGEKPERVTHVGYYLGDSEFIHSAGFVKVNSFDPEKENFSAYRADSWLGGRRIVNSTATNGIVRVSEHPWY